jgi:hypothetical protein
MKKVIRLTESDLIRLVKRVIKEQEEEWNTDKESELYSLRDKTKEFLKDKNRPRFDDYDDNESFMKDLEDWGKSSGYNDHLDKLNSRLGVKKSIRKREDDERYSNLVKNRPADFDADALNAEYGDLDSEYENDIQDWKSKYSSDDPDFYDKFDERFAPIKAKQDRKHDIRTQLSRDFKPKRGY